MIVSFPSTVKVAHAVENDIVVDDDLGLRSSRSWAQGRQTRADRHLLR